MSPARSRLAWLCRRGTRELDLLLGAYLDRAYDHAPDAERQAFAALISLSDPELQSLLFEPQAVSDPSVGFLVARIREIAASPP